MARARWISATVVVLLLATATAAQAMPIDRSPPAKVVPSNTFGKLTGRVAASAPRVWHAPAAARIVPLSCDDGSPFLCGSIRVPIDRATPAGRTIKVGFQILPAADPSRARPDPVFVAEGGPGGSTTGSRDFWGFYALASLNDTRDLVLIDQRGTGLSGAIFCRDLQNGWNSPEELRRANRRCGRTLGGDADRYGTGDIALDIEAVRRALGYNRINYVAGSYGSVVEQAYASRFPGHVRAMVIDAGLPVPDPSHRFNWGMDAAAGFVDSVALACQRAPACAAEHADPAERFEALAARLATAPISGRANDAFGNPRYITVDQTVLAWIVSWGGLNQGEIAAAADALLEHGDEAPLLRLGAESYFWPGDSGDPRFYSAGANSATWCTDMRLGFDRTAPFADRRAQFEAAWAGLPSDAFAPFTREAWRGYWWPDACTTWPSPDRYVPAVREGPPIDVPVLVIVGDLDTVVPMASSDRMATRFADPVTVRLEGGGHINLGWSPVCAQPLADRFIRTLQVGDTSCAEETVPVFPAVDRFPRTSHQAIEARSRPGDESTARDRRAAWSSVKTVLDSWFRSFRTPEAIADGAGLRGGWFHYDFSGAERALLEMHRVRFVRDIAVRGRTTFSFDFSRPRLRAHVFLRGQGTANGELRVSSRYWFDTFFGPFWIRGEIGGRQVELRMPGN